MRKQNLIGSPYLFLFLQTPRLRYMIQTGRSHHEAIQQHPFSSCFAFFALLWNNKQKCFMILCVLLWLSSAMRERICPETITSGGNKNILNSQLKKCFHCWPFSRLRKDEGMGAVCLTWYTWTEKDSLYIYHYHGL